METERQEEGDRIEHDILEEVETQVGEASGIHHVLEELYTPQV